MNREICEIQDMYFQKLTRNFVVPSSYPILLHIKAFYPVCFINFRRGIAYALFTQSSNIIHIYDINPYIS